MVEGCPYRVDMCYTIPILYTPTSCRTWKNTINARHSTNPIAIVTIHLMIFKARMNILFILKVKTLMLVQCSCMSPQSMLTIVNTIFFHTQSNLFQTCILFMSILRSTPNDIPPKCPDFYCVGVRHVCFSPPHSFQLQPTFTLPRPYLLAGSVAPYKYYTIRSSQ